MKEFEEFRSQYHQRLFSSSSFSQPSFLPSPLPFSQLPPASFAMSHQQQPDSDDDDLDGLLPHTKRGPSSSMRIQKLRNITGRTDSITALQDYLTPETLDDAKKNRDMIESSDRLKKKLGERPPTSNQATGRLSHSVDLRSLAAEVSATSPTGQQPPGRRTSLVGDGRRSSLELGGRRNSLDAKVVKRKSSVVNSSPGTSRRDSMEVTKDDGAH